MLIRYKKIISFLLTMALSASTVSVFATDNVVTDIINDDIIIKVEDTVLLKDIDYTLEYKDNVNVGTATVIVHFIGNYSGEAEQNFNIKKKTSSGGGGGSSSYKPSVQNDTNVTVTDNEGKTVTVTKSEEDNKVIISLPPDREINEDESYTITVNDKTGNPVEIEVVLKDKNGNEAAGRTDADGKIVLPITIETTPQPEPENYDHYAYISGYEDGTFIPDGKITRAETASMLYGVLETSNKHADVMFSDLVDGAWYIPAVTAMSETGVINGYPDGTFRPDNKITRAEFVTMLMQGRNIEKYTVLPFDDVSSELWSADYIYSAYKAGYIDGYEDGTFRPDSPITRAEAVKIINSTLERTDFSNIINPFSDVTSSHWAYKQILEAAVTHEVK